MPFHESYYQGTAFTGCGKTRMERLCRRLKPARVDEGRLKRRPEGQLYLNRAEAGIFQQPVLAVPLSTNKH
jgi:hypothetical protein